MARARSQRIENILVIVAWLTLSVGGKSVSWIELRRNWSLLGRRRHHHGRGRACVGTEPMLDRGTGWCCWGKRGSRERTNIIGWCSDFCVGRRVFSFENVTRIYAEAFGRSVGVVRIVRVRRTFEDAFVIL